MHIMQVRHWEETSRRIEHELERRLKDLRLAQDLDLDSATLTIAADVATLKREREYVMDARARIYG